MYLNKYKSNLWELYIITNEFCMFKCIWSSTYSICRGYILLSSYFKRPGNIERNLLSVARQHQIWLQPIKERSNDKYQPQAFSICQGTTQLKEVTPIIGPTRHFIEMYAKQHWLNQASDTNGNNHKPSIFRRLNCNTHLNRVPSIREHFLLRLDHKAKGRKKCTCKLQKSFSK